MGSLKIDDGQIEEVQELIKTLEELVNSLGEITPVHGSFYELSAKFYKVNLAVELPQFFTLYFLIVLQRSANIF